MLPVCEALCDVFPVTCGAYFVHEIWGLRLGLCQAAQYGVHLFSTLNAMLFPSPYSML
jgi:hypothetical protein